MNSLKKILVVTVVAITLGTTLRVYAETYQAGEYTITLDMNASDGKTYRGCDTRQNCIYLTQGTTWRDRGYRGISWENQGYTYSVSWREGTNQPMYLKVFDPQGRLILRRVMVVKR